jgi:hypothetical protein
MLHLVMTLLSSKPLHHGVGNLASINVPLMLGQLHKMNSTQPNLCSFCATKKTTCRLRACLSGDADYKVIYHAPVCCNWLVS